MDNNNSIVMSMINELSSQSETPAEDIFKTSNKTSDNDTKSLPKTVNEKSPDDSSESTWIPDKDLLEDLPELNRQTTGAIYNKEDVKEFSNEELLDIADDMAIDNSHGRMEEGKRALRNINAAKARFGIKNLKIPQMFEPILMMSAGDTDPKRAQEGIDTLFRDLIDNPATEIEWLPGFGPNAEQSSNINGNMSKGESQYIDIPNVNDINNKVINIPTKDNAPTSSEKAQLQSAISEPIDDSKDDGVKIIIDKSQVQELSFSKEEMDKIIENRTVELNIVERVNVDYHMIEELGDNDIDVVLSQYTRKFNDFQIVLPVSKYRCTMTGLSYPEILDLSYAYELNSLDGEMKKWTIAFKHLKNPSIGNWKMFEEKDKDGIVISSTSKFDDFLKKTAAADINHLLWGVMCASSSDTEIASINCHTNGCGHKYDWPYIPKAIFQLDSVPVYTLEEMDKTAKASSPEEIENNYASSMLNVNNTVALPSSGIVVGFGHISAYEYLNVIYPALDSITNQKNVWFSEATAASMLSVIKYFLLPKEDGEGYYNVKSPTALIKIICSLNELDYGTIMKIVDLMIEPYDVTYAIKGIVCPRCKTKSDLVLESMDELLFHTAQSLARINITLKNQ